MISYEEARSIILSNVQALPKHRERLECLLGSVLGEPVLATHDLPHFDNSAVDGYAVNLADFREAHSDNPVKLFVAGELKAGSAESFDLKPGTTMRILTGAAVPGGVDAVVMKEFCQEDNGYVRIARQPKSGENIRRRGEEFLRGQQILPEGIKITPPVVGLLASLGQASFMVHKKPTVAIISTGDELVKPGKSLTTGKIYDSNSFAIKAAFESLGIGEFLPLHVRDDLSETRKVLSLAIDFADLIITAGGVSVGEHDYVKAAAEELGVKTLIWKVAIKPGKPLYFGMHNHRKKGKRQYLFGLPGNPVSALVTFNEFVRPALSKLMGEESILPGTGERRIRAKLMRDLRKSAGRTEMVRAVVSLGDGEMVVHPTQGQESHMLGGLCYANALIHFPAESEHLQQGSIVEVKMLNWGL